MDERRIYVLPQKEKREINRYSFISLCVTGAVISFATLNAITFRVFGTTIGYFPAGIVVVLADVLHFVGCIYYVHKHDYAYGRNYERYQIANAVIYGIQNYLRVLLAVMIISLLVVPLYYMIVLLTVTIAMFCWTRRL